MAKRKTYRIYHARAVLQMQLDHFSHVDTEQVTALDGSIRSRSGVRRNPNVLDVCAAFLSEPWLGLSIDVDLPVDGAAGRALSYVKT